MGLRMKNKFSQDPDVSTGLDMTSVLKVEIGVTSRIRNYSVAEGVQRKTEQVVAASANSVGLRFSISRLRCQFSDPILMAREI